MFLHELSVTERARIACKITAGKYRPCAVHLWYFGMTPEYQRWRIECFRNQALELGGAFRTPVEDELAELARFHEERLSLLRGYSPGWGILVEQQGQISASLERLGRECPGLQWLVIPTLHEGLTLPNSLDWSEVIVQIASLGLRRLQVFGCNYGHQSACVNRVTEFLRASNDISEVAIAEAACFVWQGCAH